MDFVDWIIGRVEDEETGDAVPALLLDLTDYLVIFLRVSDGQLLVTAALRRAEREAQQRVVIKGENQSGGYRGGASNTEVRERALFRRMASQFRRFSPPSNLTFAQPTAHLKGRSASMISSSVPSSLMVATKG